MTRLVLLLGVAISLWNGCSAGDPSILLSPQLPEQESAHPKRACKLHELLPLPCESRSPEWTNDYVVEPLYNCTCPALKARYFCPAQTDPRYPKWEPSAVRQGVCTSITQSELVGKPLPPNFKVLMYGNSHLRQIVEAMICVSQDDLSSKRVNMGILDAAAFVAADMQCRSCSEAKDPTAVTDLQRNLLKHQCISESDTCRCGDSCGEFFFGNGAAVHYTFAHTQENKGLDHAQGGHGLEPDSAYDAVFLNAGNNPSMDAKKAIELAAEVQASGTQFFWLTTYNGVGSISEWTKEERVRFFGTGALYIDVQCMAQGMEAYTVGVVEGGSGDSHFCLPGPPNEIALLLLKIMWTMYLEKE